jgi:hypothetical protein
MSYMVILDLARQVIAHSIYRGSLAVAIGAGLKNRCFIEDRGFIIFDKNVILDNKHNNTVNTTLINNNTGSVIVKGIWP